METLVFCSRSADQDTAGREAAEAYDDWRKNFIRERLHVLNYLGFIANPAFIALDYLHHREYLTPAFYYPCHPSTGATLSDFFF